MKTANAAIDHVIITTLLAPGLININQAIKISKNRIGNILIICWQRITFLKMMLFLKGLKSS